MKWLLGLFPRPLLIWGSIKLRPLLRWFYRGTRFIDPIDGRGYRKFLPYGYHTVRHNALSPGTLSLERHRLLWLYLKRETTLLNDSLRVLHVAPEQAFYQKFKRFSHWDYTTTDLHSPLADIKADITDLPFEDNYFDLVLCNHVLEHIPDDTKALAELFRILKKGGTAILQVPLEEDRAETFEDDSITDPKERARIFGQYDHVRIYGRDYYKRLETVGFQAKAIDLIAKLSQKEVKQFALQNERIPLGIKP